MNEREFVENRYWNCSPVTPYDDIDLSQRWYNKPLPEPMLSYSQNASVRYSTIDTFDIIL